jgi:hypothetical protein
MTKIWSPEGDVGAPPRTLAAAPELLTGRRIAVLDNKKPNALLLMQRVADRLAERTGATVSMSIPKGTAATPAEPEVLEALQEGADLVLTGSAD